jgi:predicted MFS family arabinose efflux permease
MLASPVFGALDGRLPRKLLIATGIVLWSLATFGAGLATGFYSFLLLRSLVGVGEAAYATLSPSVISDFYPPDRRNRVLTLFNMAIPVGAALGFVLGGLLGSRFGWRYAFFFCGLPGLLTAALLLFVREPRRGDFEADAPGPRPAWPETLRLLGHNREYLFAVAGYTAVTFASGAMADWFPTYLSRLRGFTLAEAGSLTGAMTVTGGLLGTLCGGLLGDRLRGRTRKPYLAASALSMILATAFATLALLMGQRLLIALAMFLAQFFLWFYNGPINATIVNVVGARMRSRAISLSILSIHLCGDAVSPFIVGQVSDKSGNLGLGMMLIPVTLFLGAGIWLVGWRTLPPHAADLAIAPKL